MHIIQDASPTDKRVQEFLESLRQEGRAPNTVHAYAYDLAVFLRWWTALPEPRPWKDLAPEDLVRYRQHLVEERGARPATVNRHMEALRRFCRWAFRLQHLASDLAQDMARVSRIRRPRPQALREDEVQALLRTAGKGRSLALRNYALVQLFLQTGLRVSEACELAREDVVVRERTGHMHIRHGQGRKERDVPLNAMVRRALKQYLDSRPQVSPTEPLFSSTREAALSVRSVQHIVRELARRAGVTRIQVSAQTLRHTYSIRYLREHPGMLADLSALLGLDTLDSTALYENLCPGEPEGNLERNSLHARQ